MNPYVTNNGGGGGMKLKSEAIKDLFERQEWENYDYKTNGRNGLLELFDAHFRPKAVAS